MNDDDVIEALKGQNRMEHDMALKAIYEQSYVTIRNHVIQNSGTEDEAKDVFQDAMVVLYNKLKSDRFEKKSSINTFLFGIARNLWLRVLSQNKKQHLIQDELKQEDSMESIPIWKEGSDNKTILNSLMDQIGRSCQRLLKLYYYDNFSTQELRKQLNLGSEQVVRTKVYRCMKKLREVVVENNITMDNFIFNEG